MLRDFAAQWLPTHPDRNTLDNLRGFSLIHPARDGIITSYGIRPLVVQVCNIKTLSVMKILLKCDVSMHNTDYYLAFISFMHILFVLPCVDYMYMGGGELILYVSAAGV